MKTSYQLDKQATAHAPWKPGSIIAEGKTFYKIKEPIAIYRLFIGITDKGYYVVQNFYKHSNHKCTDPFVIMQPDRANKMDQFESIAIDGRLVQWHDNGQNWSDGLCQDGNEQGLWTWWYDNGKKSHEGSYHNGKAQGLWTHWYENGQKVIECEYENGNEHGRWTWWYRNGQKKVETQYREGKKQGLMTGWHDNGQKRYEGQIQDEKPQGLWKEWDKEGKKINETVFNDAEKGKNN